MKRNKRIESELIEERLIMQYIPEDYPSIYRVSIKKGFLELNRHLKVSNLDSIYLTFSGISSSIFLSIYLSIYISKVKRQGKLIAVAYSLRIY